MRFAAGAGAAVRQHHRSAAPNTRPSSRWALRVQLHGGVNRQIAGDRSAARRSKKTTRRRAAARRASDGGGRRTAFPARAQIYVFPSGSADAAWWHATPGRQHPARRRSPEAALQRRRVADLPHRHLRRRHRRLLHGDEGPDRVVGVPAAQRQHQGARQPGAARRRRALCRQPRQPPVLHRQRRTRSAVSRASTSRRTSRRSSRWACRWCSGRRPTPDTTRAGGRTSAACSSSS